MTFSRHNAIKAFPLTLLFGLAMTLFACNAPEDSEPDLAFPTAAVNSFKLKANKKILNNLDSVFFSIDLDRGLIYNADSLPKGTDISRLIPVITYSNTVKSVTLRQTDANGDVVETDYMKSPNDSIDFNKRVTLTVVASDGTTTADYSLKVNVHKMSPDSLAWGDVAMSRLPSRRSAPKAQRAVADGGSVVCLIEESDGSHTLSVSSDPAAGEWKKTAVTLPSGAEIRSLNATGGKLYILATGKLYASADNGVSWANVATGWSEILGAYDGTLLGLRNNGSQTVYTQFPTTDYFKEYPVDADFPVSGATDLCLYTTKWSELPVGFITGGKRADGSFNDTTWGFDGNVWEPISVKRLPLLTDATMIPYYLFRRNSAAWVQTEMKAWLVVGGMKADGSLNRDVYVSYDCGITWSLATENLRLPEFIPAMTGADAVVFGTSLEGEIGPGWQKLPPRRIHYDIDGYDVTWTCPYIYLFGGTAADGRLCDAIWRGVLNRLTFPPLI